jgi:hypothetical protein
VVRTLTLLSCDGCGTELPGCKCLGFANREANSLAVARGEGWKRVPLGDDVADYCPDCYAYRVLVGTEQGLAA